VARRAPSLATWKLPKDQLIPDPETDLFHELAKVRALLELTDRTPNCA